MRSGNVERKTLETGISAEWCLDGSGSCEINTGIGFFDHMLTLLAKHSFSDLVVHAVGDLDVDSHHTVEDCGIVLGQALKEAVGDKAGIHRYGNCFLPMDEALIQVCLDFSGRPYLVLTRIFLRYSLAFTMRDDGGIFPRFGNAGRPHAAYPRALRQEYASHHRSDFQRFCQSVGRGSSL